MNMLRALAVFVGILVGLARPSEASLSSDKDNLLKSGDRNFVIEAASGGMAEVKLGQLAKERGQSDIVRMFAQHMIDDHTRLSNELQQLANRKNIALPAQPLHKHKTVEDALAKLTGAAFDKQYLREMVKDHETDVAAFQKQADTGKDGDLVNWVKQSLPTLKSHLDMARDAEAKFNKVPANPVDKVSTH